jgi:heat shock protein HtpX
VDREYVSRPAPSLALRAALAVMLFVGFYVFSIALAGGLLYLPYAEWEYMHNVNPRLTIFCAVGALVIVYSLVPRYDAFKSPGPMLSPETSPRLFEMLRDVAARTEQAMPAEVFLVVDVNAWVAQRGGLMGVGSRRVMGLGLPLMESLSVSQLRAVIAHEFGHYHAGDTALGPWLYATQKTIHRTLQNMQTHSRYLTFFFKWYAFGFARVTHAISRRQELVADALAAQIAGVEAMIGGLTNLHGADVAFMPYWQTEVQPILDNGFRPPIAHGFRTFLAQPNIAQFVTKEIEANLASGVAGKYDSHPPLRERVAALRAMPHATGTSDDALSTTLLGSLEAEEERLITHLAASRKGPPFQPIDWDAAPAAIWIPAWTRMATQFGDRLAGVTPEQLPTLLDDRSALARRFGADGNKISESDQARAVHVVACALATMLLSRGWTAEAPPGAPIRFLRDGQTIAVFKSVDELASGALDRMTWTDQCNRADIAGVDLGLTPAA